MAALRLHRSRSSPRCFLITRYLLHVYRPLFNPFFFLSFFFFAPFGQPIGRANNFWIRRFDVTNVNFVVSSDSRFYHTTLKEEFSLIGCLGKKVAVSTD